MPKQPLTLHWHEHGRAPWRWPTAELRVVDKRRQAGSTSYKLTAGKAMWLGVDPPGRMHADIDPGTKPVEVIVVELKKDRP